MQIAAEKAKDTWWYIFLIHDMPAEIRLFNWRVKLHDDDGIALECQDRVLVIPEHNISGILIHTNEDDSEKQT